MTTITHPSFTDPNPLWLKSVRSRLRVRHLLSWGLITLTFTAFAFLITYLTMTEQELASKQDAAKATLPIIIIIQAVILMMFGTGSVAAGVSQERDEGLLDYQRMTPMRPTAKILGYLFGLPVREYMMFALTMPFVIAAVWISDFRFSMLLHFYAVFFTSVWVYHLTGLVAGMVSPKPRLASMTAMGLVMVLYFVLPNLSRLGITYFEFLTIRPTLLGMVWDEMPASWQTNSEFGGIDSIRDVPMFAGSINSTLYTMLVQGSLIVLLFSIVHRKWRDESNHIFSKAGGLAVFIGVAFFALASVWAVITRDEVYDKLFHPFSHLDVGKRAPEMMLMFAMITWGLLAGAYLLVITFITPSNHTASEGLRRAKRLGKKSSGWNSNGSSSLPVALAMLTIMLLFVATVMGLGIQSGKYFSTGPQIGPVILLIVTILGCGLFVQGLREVASARVFGLALFVLWIVPIFAMLIIMAAFEQYLAGAYTGIACPLVSITVSMGWMMDSAIPIAGGDPEFLPPKLGLNAMGVVTTAAIGYGLAGVLAQAARWKMWHQIKAG